MGLTIASGAIEQIFYGARIGQDGILKESLFLPLAFFFMALTVMVFLVIVKIKLLKYFLNKKP